MIKIWFRVSKTFWRRNFNWKLKNSLTFTEFQ